MTDPGTIADRLLEAHVAHQIARLRGPQFVELVQDEVDYLLSKAGELTLEQAVHRDQVKAVAIKYVAGFDLPGAIPEIAGDIAARLRLHPSNDTELRDLLPRRHVQAAVEKIAELRPLREAIVARVAQSPSVQTWLGQYLYSLATAPIATNRRLAQRVPGVSSALSVGERLAGGVVREADLRSRELAEKAAGAMLSRWRDGTATGLDDDELADALLELWDGVDSVAMREIFDAVGEDDIVDLIVVGYDAWLDLRESPYVHSLIETGVDYFFDTYGDYELDALLEEFGLGPEDLVEEALRFAPRAIEALADTGLLEDMLRRQLTGFYASPEVAAILADRA